MRNFLQTLIAVSMLAGFSLSAHAEGAAKKPAMKMEMPELTKEQRSTMATAHEKMAACLRSEKSLQDCHEEMRKTCKETDDHCPMMGMMMGPHGMRKMMHKNSKDENK